jgi:hypothetical protein
MDKPWPIKAKMLKNKFQVLLPSDTNLGTIIYKLRAQDADENYPLNFTAYGKNFSFKAFQNRRD